jgi:chromosome segregation ATPase
MALLLVSLGFGGYSLFEKQKIEEEKAVLQGELDQAASRDTKQQLQIKTLEDENKNIDARLQEEIIKTGSLQDEIDAAQNEFKALEEDLRNQITKLNDEKKGWDQRIDRISKERDELLVKLQSASAQQPAQQKEPEIYRPSQPGYEVQSTRDAVDEAYWAEILKQKAQLEVEVESLKDKIGQDSLQIVELKQKNQELELKIDTLESEKSQIETTIMNNEEMTNRISLELARAKNDRKFEETQVGKLKEENLELRGQLKELITSKNALEKSIIRLTQDKVKMEKKIGQTETIIQSKIDEIWEIKDSLDQSIKSSGVATSTNDEVELPPIVVKAGNETTNFNKSMSSPGFNGKVVSINDENNFVIVDIGETQGLRLGDTLSVYRDSKYIARLEVIQVRKDIAAADIKDQWSQVRIGDAIH